MVKASNGRLAKSPFSIALTELKVGGGGSKRSFVLSGFCQLLQNEPESLDTTHSSPNCDPPAPKSFYILHWDISSQASLLLPPYNIQKGHCLSPNSIEASLPELFKDEHLHGLKLGDGDGAVSEDDEVEERHGARVVQL